MKIHTQVSLLIFCFFFLAIFARGDSLAQVTPQVILEPTSQKLDIGKEFNVDVILDSDQPLVGADVKLRFDPQILEVVSIESGDAFSKIPQKSISEGSITITGLSGKGENFKGTGRIALVRFKAKDAASTKVELEYSENNTKDSNLTTAKVTDALSKGAAGQYMIGSSLQRGTASIKRFLIKALPFIIFLISLGIAAFYAYRYWKQQQSRPKNIFVPQEIPMDKPPDQ